MSEHMGLTTPTREQAERWIGDVSMFRNLEVVEMRTGGARTNRWLSSLLDLVEFLVPVDDAGRLSAIVNYADADKVVAWVRDAVGDSELADRMQRLVDGRTGYAKLAPALRELALARVVQCWELLKTPEEPGA